MDTLGLTRFPLLGISQGGAVAVTYAVRHPERVSHLILYGAYATGWKHRADAEEMQEREALMTLMHKGWGRDNPAYRQLFTSLFLPEGHARAGGLVQRAAAHLHIAGQRGPVPAGLRWPGRLGSAGPGLRADSRASRTGRRPGPLRPGTLSGFRHSRQPVRGIGQPESPDSGARRRLDRIRGRGQGLPGAGARRSRARRRYREVAPKRRARCLERRRCTRVGGRRRTRPRAGRCIAGSGRSHGDP